ncbi:MAG: ABC transporter substrate-binding protein [Leptospiraceae bacterium]|nr:ABC transporter substrate-binding protein [Leptospiraceae bacterium]
MKYFTKFTTIALLSVLFSTIAYAGPAEEMKSTISSITSVLASNKKPGDKKKELSKIYYDSFDVRLLSQRTLRNLWKTKLNAKQQDSFAEKFGKFILVYYLSRMENYNNNKIEFNGETMKGKEAAIVHTLVEYNGKMGKVDYLVRNRGGKWLVYDVEIEGIMLSTTYRQQFAEVLAAQGYDALSKELDTLIKKYTK